jgi:hypothetical protein
MLVRAGLELVLWRVGVGTQGVGEALSPICC